MEPQGSQSNVNVRLHRATVRQAQEGGAARSLRAAGAGQRCLEGNLVELVVSDPACLLVWR